MHEKNIRKKADKVLSKSKVCPCKGNTSSTKLFESTIFTNFGNRNKCQ